MQFKKSNTEKLDLRTLEKKYLSILKISNLVGQENTLDRILQSSVETIVDAMEYISAVVFINKESERRIYSSTFTNKLINNVLTKLIDEPFDKLSISYDVSDNYIVSSVLRREVLQGTELSKFITPVVSEKIADVLQKATFAKRIISIPLLFKDHVLGAIMFTKKGSDPYDNDLNLLHAYADYLSVAIYNSQQTEEIRLQNRDLNSIFLLSSEVTSTLNPNEVAQKAVDSLPQEEFLIGGMIAFFDKNTNKLALKAVSTNQLTEKVKELIGDLYKIEIDISKYDSPAGIHHISKVMNEKKTDITSDITNTLAPTLSKSVLPIMEKLIGIKTIVTSPLLYKGEIAGIISYYVKDRFKEQLTTNQISLLEIYSNQINSALANAFAYEENVGLLESLNEKVVMLEDTRRKERDMMDIMGHELRTPLSIIKMATSVANMKINKGDRLSDEYTKEFITKINDALDREVKLLERMISSTKIDSHRMEIKLEQIKLIELVENSLLANKSILSSKQIEIIKQIDGNMIAFADQLRLSEVFDNLIGNAVKYTEKGEITITAEETKNSMIKISIKDTGRGIPKEALPKLGEKFFRVDNYIPNKNDRDLEIVRPGGTGLGLYVSFGLIKLMGGEVEVKSELGKGSEFAFTLPKYTGQQPSGDNKVKHNVFERLGLENSVPSKKQKQVHS